jgi:sulfane dehydrogenase subunit SoxC
MPAFEPDDLRLTCCGGDSPCGGLLIEKRIMTLAPDRAAGPFTTRWYNDPVLDSSGQETGRTEPVWPIAPEALIVASAPHDSIDVAIEREIWGWAWADGGVHMVHVSIDGGATWQAAQLEPPHGREWQRFSIPWTPTCRGKLVLAKPTTHESLKS